MLLNVSKPTDQVNSVAYSSTQAVLTLGRRTERSVFPVIHQGCYENVASVAASGTVSTTDVGIKCGGLRERRRRLRRACVGVGAFTDPATGNTYSSSARVELIPIAFPQTLSETTDFTLGARPSRYDFAHATTIGAVEIPVVATSTGADRGGPVNSNLLTVTAANTTITATLNTWELANTTTYQPYFFDQTQGKWLPDTSAALAGAKAVTGFDEVAITKLDHLGWLGITDPSTQTTCVTGSLTAGGAPATNVWVHATGLNYFGTSSTVTASDGTFCLDGVKTAGGDAGATPQVGDCGRLRIDERRVRHSADPGVPGVGARGGDVRDADGVHRARRHRASAVQQHLHERHGDQHRERPPLYAQRRARGAEPQRGSAGGRYSAHGLHRHGDARRRRRVLRPGGGGHQHRARQSERGELRHDVVHGVVGHGGYLRRDQLQLGGVRSVLLRRVSPP